MAIAKKLISNIEVLKDSTHVNERFQGTFIQTGEPYSNKILAAYTLQALLSKADYRATENEIIDFVQREESKILDGSKDPDILKHLPDNSETIFKSVLEVALEDDSICRDEMALLKKLRSKLHINEKDQYIILARLNHFPNSKNEPHGLSEIKNSLSELQKCGLVFYCNQPQGTDEKFFVIPEEIAQAVKSLLGIELMEEKFALLLNNFNMEQLRTVAKHNNLPSSGTKDILIERVITAGIKPSEALDLLSVIELQDLALKCKGLKKAVPSSGKI
ncbi:MAG: SAP domain-containing protein [Owenweeksia sp.]|nr:SAP domain-containing protein [Owenweeksia sp.]